MAMKIALQGVVTGRGRNSETSLAPSPKRRVVPKNKLEEQFRLVQQGEWGKLLARISSIDEQTHQLSPRRRRRYRQNDKERLCDREGSLVHMGELSAARKALEAAPVAPGNMATLKKIDGP